MLGVTKRIAPDLSTMGAREPTEHNSAETVIPYDENLLERSRTQWQRGDWMSLAAITRDSLQYHPDRAKLAILAAAGHLQIGDKAAARQLTRLAQEWGCSKKLISQILIAGVHNTIGRAAEIGKQHDCALRHFECSISVCMPSSDTKLLAHARSEHQYNQLSRPIKENQYRESFQNYIANETNDSKNLSVTFSEIYQTGVWGQQDGWEYYSGSGSHDDYIVASYVDGLNNYFGSSSLSLSALDIGCGDFNVGCSLSKNFYQYTAIDIVHDLIEYNKEKYKDSGAKFICLDATCDELPEADVILLRQVLQHLSNEKILQLLKNIKNKCKYLVVVEHIPVGEAWPKNLDFTSGKDIRLFLNSGVDIEVAPFNWIYKSKKIISENPESTGVIACKIYGM